MESGRKKGEVFSLPPSTPSLPAFLPRSLPILVKLIGYLFNQCDWLYGVGTRIGYFNQKFGYTHIYQFLGCFNQSVFTVTRHAPTRGRESFWTVRNVLLCVLL